MIETIIEKYEKDDKDDNNNNIEKNIRNNYRERLKAR